MGLALTEKTVKGSPIRILISFSNEQVTIFKILQR